MDGLLINVHYTSIPPKRTAISCFHKITRSYSYGGGGGGGGGVCFRISASKIPARDRVIDLGKYRGKMLGSLPSSYLKWVSKNMRAGDTEEWAKLADEVLGDEVYRDRIEWEFAENVLNGNAVTASSNIKGNEYDAVSKLLEISERFGWDNENKGGWSKIDFGLLGTSKGGRIPRLTSRLNVKPDWNLKKENIKSEEDGCVRRRERRERARQLRATITGPSTSSSWSTVKSGRSSDQNEGEQAEVIPIRSPFPGREALLNKVLVDRNKRL